MFHAYITKAFCTVKHSHTVITFSVQPFHWGETERRGGQAERKTGRGEKERESKAVKQRGRENNKGKKQAWEKK